MFSLLFECINQCTTFTYNCQRQCLVSREPVPVITMTRDVEAPVVMCDACTATELLNDAVVNNAVVNDDFVNGDFVIITSSECDSGVSTDSDDTITVDLEVDENNGVQVNDKVLNELHSDTVTEQ